GGCPGAPSTPNRDLPALCGIGALLMGVVLAAGTRHLVPLPWMPKKPKATLALRLHRPATPRLVADIVPMFAEALDSIAPGLSEHAVTLVVENFFTRTIVRGWGDEGGQAVTALEHLVEDPESTLEIHPEYSRAAEVIARKLAPLSDDNVEFKNRNKHI